MSQYLSQWREKLEATETIELSVGPAVIRTSVSLLDLAAAGKIPATLIVHLESLSKTAAKDPVKAATENFDQLLQAANAVALAAFIDPPLSAEGDDDHLPVSAIPFADKLTVFYRLNREVEPLRDFRQEQGRANGTARAGDGVPLPTVGDSTDS